MIQNYRASFFQLASTGVLCEILADHNIERLIMTAYKIIKALRMPEREHPLMIMAAHMHDLGKILIPKYILKKRSLTKEEREIINSHPIIGAKLAGELGFPDLVIDVIWGHHENWDGSGYPCGMRGEEIHSAARVMRIVDHFDAIQCKRPYHEPLNAERAYLEVMTGRGTLFDPEIIDVLPKLLAVH